MLIRNGAMLIRNSAMLIRNSAALIRNSAALIRNSAMLIRNSAALIRNISSFLCIMYFYLITYTSRLLFFVFGSIILSAVRQIFPLNNIKCPITLLNGSFRIFIFGNL
jgi:hypothetical protein